MVVLVLRRERHSRLCIGRGSEKGFAIATVACFICIIKPSALPVIDLDGILVYQER